MSETRVINIRSGEHYDIYIGRAVPRKGLKASIWANPYKSPRDGTPAECVAKYKAMVLSRPELLRRLPELRGKVLACWCRPDPCHGGVLVELLNE